MPKKVIKISLAVALIAVLLPILVSFVYPSVAKLKKENPKKTSFMEYREEQWKDAHKKVRITQQWVPISRISNYVLKAVIISEDDKFWQHHGFDFDAMEKSLEKDIKSKKLKFGGSTISQQLAKNLFLSPSKNPLRKIREAILTWRIEHNLSKRRILELYLNVAEWGNGIFGVEAASMHYFGKHAADLDAMEAARLVTVLPNPRRYNAAGDSAYITRRSHFIYEIMVKRGYVDDYEEIMKTPDQEQE